MNEEKVSVAELISQRRNVLLSSFLLIAHQLLQLEYAYSSVQLLDQQLIVRNPQGLFFLIGLFFCYSLYRFISTVHVVAWYELVFAWRSSLYQHCFAYLRQVPHADQIPDHDRSSFGDGWFGQLLLRNLVEAIKQSEDASLVAELCKEKLRSGQFDKAHSRGLVLRILWASILFVGVSKVVADYISPVCVALGSIVFCVCSMGLI